MREHRRRINDDLKDSPSLVPYLQQVLADCYANAREQAADETSLELEAFPLICPYALKQLLNPGYLPD
jgi:Domain of unknown function DUF29